MNNQNRRNFLKAGTTLSASLLATSAFSSSLPAEKAGTGFIGLVACAKAPGCSNTRHNKIGAFTGKPLVCRF